MNKNKITLAMYCLLSTCMLASAAELRLPRQRLLLVSQQKSIEKKIPTQELQNKDHQPQEIKCNDTKLQKVEVKPFEVNPELLDPAAYDIAPSAADMGRAADKHAMQIVAERESSRAEHIIQRENEYETQEQELNIAKYENLAQGQEIELEQYEKYGQELVLQEQRYHEIQFDAERLKHYEDIAAEQQKLREQEILKYEQDLILQTQQQLVQAEQQKIEQQREHNQRESTETPTTSIDRQYEAPVDKMLMTLAFIGYSKPWQKLVSMAATIQKMVK